MSNYISSFFIDPVVRQARRLSRPSFSAENPGEHAAATTPPPPATATPAQFLNFRAPSFTLPSLLSSREAVSTSTLPVFPDDNLSRNGPPQIVEIANLEPTVRARQYTIRYAENQGEQPRDVAGPAIEVPIAVPVVPAGSQEAAPLVERATQSLRTEYNTPDGLHDRPDIAKGYGLAEDDGMGQLRGKIRAIQQAEATSEAKARMIYGLMTEKYSASQQTSPSRARSPVSIQSSGRPYTPCSPKSTESLRPCGSPPTSSSSAEESSNPFQLIPEDLQPTFWQHQASEQRDSLALSRDSMEEPKHLGCAHYKRNIKLQCSACNRWYTCRFCHDAVEDHMLNRRETKCMLCMLCGCAQPASPECVLCGYTAAWYYCDVCKLWDDDPDKEIYHCEDCGICRIGAGIGKSHLHCKVRQISSLLKQNVVAKLTILVDMRRVYGDQPF